MDNYRMIHSNITDIDYTKVKRLFTFGCSFTFYSYPTWANIMSKNFNDIEFYNFGASGGGNQFISNRITEVNRKFKFNEDDLIMVMWSTHCREDRFINPYWKIPGNIFSQNVYPEKFVKENCDPLGYLIKDLSLIDLTTTYLNSLPAISFQMFSVPIEYQHEHDDVQIKTSVLETYSDLIKKFNISLFESLPGQRWPSHIKYFDHVHNRMLKEYHPTPKQYYDYLKLLNIPMTAEAEKYASEADEILHNAKTMYDLAVFENDCISGVKGVNNEGNGLTTWL
jgi:hypothetical protein